MPTGIEWTDETWNPTTGCDRCSPGCAHCYIERTVPFRIEGRRFDEHGKMGVRLHPDRLDKPLRWRKPRRVFVNSLSDLFHPDIPDAFIAKVFGIMAAAGEHTFQVLTKRPKRMSRLLVTADFRDDVHSRLIDVAQTREVPGFEWPLPNVWLGTSIENAAYTFRAALLAATPAAVRFLSCEPLLGPLLPSLNLGGVDWVIAGGESGPGSRPMHPSAPYELMEFCRQRRLPFFFKQWGDWAPVAPVYSRSDPFAHEDKIDVAMDGGRMVAAVCPSGHVAQLFEGGPEGSVHTDHQPCVRAWWMERVGKKHAGRELFGRVWDGMPQGVA